MATVTAGKTYDSFMKGIQVVEYYARIIFRPFFYCAWFFFGATAWYLFIVQGEAQPLVAIALMVISVVGGIASLVTAESEADSHEWAKVNNISGLLMLAVIGAELLFTGLHTSVPEHYVRYMNDSSAYFPGQVAPRISWHRPIWLNGVSDSTYEWDTEESVVSKRFKIKIKTVATLREELRPGFALEQHLQFLQQHPIQHQGLNKRLWADNDLEVARIQAQLAKMSPYSIQVGMTFPAQRPWLQPIRVTDVTPTITEE